MTDDRPGVLFDVDGTLLDTNYLQVLAWAEALRDTGYRDVTMSAVHRAIGIGSEELVQRLTGGDDPATVEAKADATSRCGSRSAPSPVPPSCWRPAPTAGCG
jgi:phosphoglycolate phosphatase-like HAD superfamily hydrolase